MLFPSLMSPFNIGNIEIRNRIFSTGHDTYLPVKGRPSDELIAYQVARAKGGAGLIIIQVVGVHESAKYTDSLLMGTDDDCIESFSRLIKAIQQHGTRVFVQLFHPGRELLGRPEGVLQPAYAPSATPSERFKVSPRALDEKMLQELINGYAQTARRMSEAGADGVEIVASHGYLPAQFMSKTTNCRTDRYGGSFENRLRFVREVIGECRSNTPTGFVVGLRYSAFEADEQSMQESDSLKICASLAPQLDYLNVIAGTSSSSGGATHIVPPMSIATGYLAPYSKRLKDVVEIPVLVASRINQPQNAEQIIARNEADMCGMTRAMICDPEMPNKTAAGEQDSIRACIGCNQACIGHFQMGLPISCIQRPETGRELSYGTLFQASRSKRVIVIGGGVAGMKAAITAAKRGHNVTLLEASNSLGGQAKLAQLLPGRSEFGGIITNLLQELDGSGVDVRLGEYVTPEHVLSMNPDTTIVATGSKECFPKIDLDDGVKLIHANEVLRKDVKPGGRVVIYDWPANWIGVGIAERLVEQGCSVRLAVNGVCAAEAIQNYMRDEAIAKMYKLGVEVLSHMRLYGVDSSSAYFLHTAAQQPVVLDDVDSVVVVWPNEPEVAFVDSVNASGVDCHVIGDALCARTCEEAIFEGLQAGCVV